MALGALCRLTGLVMDVMADVGRNGLALRTLDRPANRRRHAGSELRRWLPVIVAADSTAVATVQGPRGGGVGSAGEALFERGHVLHVVCTPSRG